MNFSDLPQYARNADRTRLIKVLCKGRCRQVRWEEMNRPYQGKKPLREAEMGVYEARCLMCGKIALDNYNWFV